MCVVHANGVLVPFFNNETFRGGDYYQMLDTYDRCKAIDFLHGADLREGIEVGCCVPKM